MAMLQYTAVIVLHADYMQITVHRAPVLKNAGRCGHGRSEHDQYL